MTTPRRTENAPKKQSMLSRLTSGLKKVLNIGKGKKTETKPHAKAEHAHVKDGAAHSLAQAPDHAPTLHAHKRPHDGPPREPRGPRSDRPERSGDRPRRERGDRPPREGAERGDRPPRREGPSRDGPPRREGAPGRDGPPRGRGRGGREESGEPREEKAPRVNHAAVPPPPAPPVPEGPFPAAFEALGLSPAVLAAVRDTGYETPTTIQEKSIPIILTGKDLVGASQTGTGKTAAFALPTLTKLGAPGTFRCLVLEPVRELAAQVVEQFEKYGAHTGLRVLLVHGGVGYEKQRKGLQEGVDVVVATPGRLLDFMQDGTADLRGIEVLILDEVDRMLDMGFLPDVRRIVEKTPSNRQTLFFSATMPPQIKSLADFALKDPESVEVGIRFSAAETVSHYMYPVAGDQREELLLAILKQTHFESVMIFTRTKVQADQLFKAIDRLGEYKAAVMHSDIAQKERERALNGFRSGEFEIIVATDLAARGIDVSGVTHVINYMVPENAEDYVHRIGRTGRAQKEGDAFTLFSAEELMNVASIERMIAQKIPRRKLSDFKYTYTTVLDEEDKARAILTGRKKKKRR